MARSPGTSAQELALSFFERPTEPVFMPKGQKGIVLDVPADYLSEKYRPLATSLKTRFNVGQTTNVQVKPIAIPDLTRIYDLKRRENFSLFIPKHREIAAQLLTIFMNMQNFEDFVSISAFCRDRVNPNMFMYAFSVALLHRPDTRNVQIPPLSEIFPDKYVDGAVFARAREQATVLEGEPGPRVPLEIPRDYTATDLDPEHRVAYFREDMGINLHHWHWHLVYPFNGPREIVAKDRRGELFYFMHQQIVARYNIERMCNKLPRVKRLLNFFEPLEEGYFPKLDSQVSSRTWAPRPSGALLKDVEREIEELKFDLQDLVRWRDRIYEAIHKGRVENPDGSTTPLTEQTGIDILGNILESSPVLTPNANLYGDFHNLVHVAIALCHDPDNRHLETFGVIAEPATAMRDPAFYRLHAMINDIFVEHKNTLPRYTPAQLGYDGIRVTSIEIVTPNAPKNVVQTFWQQSDLDLSRGMDFTPRGPVFARFTHLQHQAFQYRITVENNTTSARQGTVRIFMAPKFDERGLPMLLVDQKDLMIEMDRFVVTLKNSPKQTTVTRNSAESTVTIPFDRTFRDLEAGRPAAGSAQEEQFNFCGCGWPQHMLVPKGDAGGFPMELFVMVSNYNDDRVENANRQPGPGACSDAAVFCGVRDRVYPDKRPMGFPFDRLPRGGVSTLRQFLTTNMAVTDVSINFSNRVVPRQQANNETMMGY